MADPVQSVTGKLLAFVQAHQQFTNLRAAWEAFLDYLQDRRGADIGGASGMHDLEVASRFVESEAFERPANASDDDREWFHGFERREDVLAALTGFLSHRGLVG
jgi:hypothetical protein